MNIKTIKIIKYQSLLFGVLLCLSAFSYPDKMSELPKHNPVVGNRSIAFIKNDYVTALKKAKAEGKYLFVDAYASWCGPCKQLKQTTFNHSPTADFFNKSFVNLSVDMERGQGPGLASKWRVEEYPTLLIIDMNGKILSRAIGYLNADQLTAFGKQGLQEK
ncbi:thioredoxin family protein [Pedobacter insulae]|uniref:Thioredoxin-like n=1 Tax=Pedobacter insulae TaxID=414048 RepID=A0A1I2Y3N0_9SPHI|nr:thioredoxin fold domain-containing protein [Pedobacter insulae]SFH19969.1 Thioredoxin-like [Pedobacter insulae]